MDIILNKQSADIFVPDGTGEDEALKRTTHMGIGAHQDDLEIMALHGILECFGKSDAWFSGVTMSNGAGAPRDGIYVGCSDEELCKIRHKEQRKAAFIGEYSAMLQLMYTSAELKQKTYDAALSDIRLILDTARPRVIYTHNLFDKHDTHVATALAVIRAIRSLPKSHRPQKLYGCEVWRGLDWLSDNQKLVFDVSSQQNISRSLVGVFDSQITAKRYDNAAEGRRMANATFMASHSTDNAKEAVYGMDMSVLISDDSLDVMDFAEAYVDMFKEEVMGQIRKLY